MRAGVLLAMALSGLAACTGEPRSAAYFEAHVEEAIRVAARCRNGDHRGRECDHAAVAVAAADRKARMDRYRQSF